MLEQNTTNHSVGFATFDLNVAVNGAAAVKANAPISIATSAAQPKLAELTARAETLLAHLEARLQEERNASERATRTTADLDERLRLGVRMLQAFDVQVERGDLAATRAKDAMQTTDESMRANASAMVSVIANASEVVSVNARA